MTAFPLKIVTPEKIFFDGSAERVVLRTSEGDLCILARHEPFVASLPSGPVRITVDGADRYAALSTGVVLVGREGAGILACAIEWAEDIDLAWAKRSEQQAIDRKNKAKSDAELRRAELKLQRALNRIHVSGMQK